MSISKLQTDLLTTTYSLVRNSGVLQTSLGRRAFRSAYFLYKQHIEDNLHKLLQAHPTLLGTGNVLDIGANIGYTASVLARDVAAGRKVYAFEPEAFNFLLLQQTAERPEFKCKINANQCAVGAENGTVDFWYNDRHHADHRVATDAFRLAIKTRTRAVPMVTVDSFLANNSEPVSFAKIDVQGYELKVCEGMERTLEENHDIAIVLEYSPADMRSLGFEPSELLSFVTHRGFNIYAVGSKGRLTPGMPLNFKESEYIDLLLSRRHLSCEREA